jgi:hypothetical protein
MNEVFLFLITREVKPDQTFPVVIRNGPGVEILARPEEAEDTNWMVAGIVVV